MAKKMEAGQTQTLKKVLHYMKPYRFFLLLSVILAAITVASTLYLPLLIGKAVDCIVGKGNVNFDGLIAVLIKMAVMIGITALAQWIMNVCNNKLTYQIVRDIRNEAFEKIEVLPLKYIDGHAHGEIVSRVIADVDQFADGLLMGFTQLFTGVITILGTIGFMLSVNVGITIVVLVVTPVSLFVASFIAKRTFSMFKAQSEARGEQTALIDEMIGNQKIVQAFGQEKDAIEKFDEINGRLQTCSLKAIFFSSITNPSTRFVNSLVYTGVGIFGALAAINGRLTVGQLSSFLSYANQYTKPFNEISGVISEVQSAFASFKRVVTLLEEPNEVDEGTNEIVLPIDKVEFRHVEFSYVKEQQLITDFNLTIKQGQKVAIVGPTGCGKTTMINLLLRYYDPVSGGIYIDDVNTLDIKKNSLRKAYGLVLQDTWIFRGTVRENIAYAKPEATLEEVIEAAKLAHAHSFIKRLPDGYDTVISATSGLSQGEKQLITIARLMMTVPDVVILDEATSSIDTLTEQKIVEAFNYIMDGRTSFVIAHRLSTIQGADLIIVMNKGNIVEVGNHQELIKKNGFYTKLYNQGIVDN